MSISRIKLDESTKLEFGVQITGAESRPSARFIIEGPEFSLNYPCRATTGGVEVELSSMEHILESGEYPVRLEVIIENKIYTPFEDTIVLEPSVKITTKPKPVEQVREAVAVEGIRVTNKQPVKESREPAISDAKQKKMACLIAEALGHRATQGEPAEIINEAMNSTAYLTRKRHDLVSNMLTKAQELGIQFDHRLVPPVRR